MFGKLASLSMESSMRRFSILVLTSLAVGGCAMSETEQAHLMYEQERSQCRKIVDAGASGDCMRRAEQLYGERTARSKN
jgi:hypothetical protein